VARISWIWIRDWVLLMKNEKCPDTMSIKVNIDKMPLPVILKFDGKFTKIKHIKVFQPPLDGWWKERMTEYCFRKTSLL